MSNQRSLGRFEVEKPHSYESFPLAPAEAELKESAKKMRAEMVVSPPGTTKKRAAWIVHGMGQQVPYETLEQLAEGLIRAAERSSPGVRIKPLFREVRVGDTVLQRVELTFPRPGADPQEVHMYECYWAPITEGAVQLRDVVGFLWDGGGRGLINFWTKFARALFGNMVEFSLTLRTPLYLLLTLAILAALTVINAIVVGIGASLIGISSAQKFVPCALIQPLTSLASIVCAVAITFGVTLFLAEMSRPTRDTTPAYGRRLRDLTWIAFGVTVATILTGAGRMAFFLLKAHFVDHFMPLALPVVHFDNVVVFIVISILFLARIVGWRNVSRQRSGPQENATVKEREDSEKSLTLRAMFYVSFLIHVMAVAGVVWLAWPGRSLQLPSPLAWLWDSPCRILHYVLGASWGGRVSRDLHRLLISSFWIWPFLFLISAAVRQLLVQFVGDVTAYIASNKIDRFETIRKKIKDAAKQSAGAVYLAKADGSNNFEYEKVAIVGHSLGSVIAYDTLNRLIADDALGADRTGIIRRTCLFLTFGSPLDKIAFFFSMMGKSTRHIREQLAAVVQPLIQDYKNRPYPWVNVYSRNDVICGHLDFYDLPNTLIPAKAKPVYNVRDEEALIPLVAHVEYWTNRTVWNELFAEITHITGSPEIPRTPENEGPGPLRRGFDYLRNKFLAMKNTLAGRSARRRMK